MAVPGALSGEGERRSFQWDLARGPRNYATLLAWQIIAALASLASAWLATRLLGPDGYGSVVAFVAAAQTAVQIALHWSAASLLRFGVEDFVQAGSIARSFWARGTLLIVNLALVLGSAPLWLPYVERWLRLPPASGTWVLVYLAASAVSVHVQHAAQAAKLPGWQGALFGMERLLVLALLLSLALTHRADFYAILLAYILGPVVASLVVLVRLRRLILPFVAPDWRLMRKVLSFSLPLVPFCLVGFFSTNYLDAYFINRFLTPGHLAIYAVAYQAAGLTLQFPSLAGTLVLPLFVSLQAGGRENAITRFLREVLPLVTLVWSLACVLIAFIGALLLPRIFGAAFAAGSELLWPLLAGFACFAPVVMGYGPLSTTHSRTGMAAAMGIAGAVANVVLNLLLIPRYGLLGCAWATLGAYLAQLLVLRLLVTRLVKSPGWGFLAAGPALAAAVMRLVNRGAAEALAVAVLTAAVVFFLQRTEMLAGMRLIVSRLRVSPTAQEGAR